MPETFLPPVAFYFKVVIGDSLGSETSFQEVSGLSVEMETENVKEGGENTFTWELPKGIKHGTLDLKRGLLNSESALYQWCYETLERSFANPINPLPVQVMLMNADGVALNTWFFTNAFPVKWSASELNSTKNDIVVESVSLRYSNMWRI